MQFNEKDCTTISWYVEKRCESLTGWSKLWNKSIVKGQLLLKDYTWSKLCTRRGFYVGANDLSLTRVNFKLIFTEVIKICYRNNWNEHNRCLFECILTDWSTPWHYAELKLTPYHTVTTFHKFLQKILKIHPDVISNPLNWSTPWILNMWEFTWRWCQLSPVRLPFQLSCVLSIQLRKCGRSQGRTQ